MANTVLRTIRPQSSQLRRAVIKEEDGCFEPRQVGGGNFGDFSVEAFKKNQVLWQLRDRDPGLYEYAMESLKAEKLEVLADLLKKSPSSSGYAALQRKLWQLDGAIHLGLDTDLLDKIAKKFADINAIPLGYDLPELYQKQASGCIGANLNELN